jgi:hypothetical protein
MFDPTQLDPETRKAIIENAKRTRNNPIAMLKLRTLQKALMLKHWVDSNHKQHIADFHTVFDGFQAQIERLFQDFEKELLGTLGAEQNEE